MLTLALVEWINLMIVTSLTKRALYFKAKKVKTPA